MRVELIIAQYGIHVNFYKQVGFDKPVIFFFFFFFL